ncbi:MAG TPA: GNAT family N-acetyltransferase, partial [Candidatus Nanoarchaeia archaeon]|nr:GNAT family N-acetyltransferase [Candidatus Nanoarchaeia archaeon]
LVKIPTLQQFPASAYVLNLKPSETELFANFEKRCRNAISRAEREHFSLRRVSSLAEIKEYYELHKETYRRTGVVPHPYTYFRGIWEQFGKRDIANFFIAERDGQAVAAINIAVFKGNALYWTGCSKTAELHTGINNLLQWNAIRFAKQQGCSWYALGDAFPDARGKLGGLDRFKGSFGAATKQFFKGKITYHPNKERVLGILQLIKQRCTGR